MPLGYYRGGTSEGSLLRNRQQRTKQLSREEAAESALDKECKTLLPLMVSHSRHDTALHVATGVERKPKKHDNRLWHCRAA